MFGGAGIGYSLFGQPQWMFPPGYNSKQATKRIARQFTAPDSAQGSPWASAATGGTRSAQETRQDVSAAQVEHRSGIWGQAHSSAEATRQQIFGSFPDVEKQFQIICGTPKSVLPKIRKVLECLRPGIFFFWQNDGPITREDRINNIRLLGNEVVPAVREMGKELDLKSPFEVPAGFAPAGGRQARRNRLVRSSRSRAGWFRLED